MSFREQGLHIASIDATELDLAPCGHDPFPFCVKLLSACHYFLLRPERVVFIHHYGPRSYQGYIRVGLIVRCVLSRIMTTDQSSSLNILLYDLGCNGNSLVQSTDFQLMNLISHLYFLPLPLALKVFNGSTLPFLPRTTFLAFPLTYFFRSSLGMFRPTKPTSSGFLPLGSK